MYCIYHLSLSKQFRDIRQSVLSWSGCVPDHVIPIRNQCRCYLVPSSELYPDLLHGPYIAFLLPLTIQFSTIFTTLKYMYSTWHQLAHETWKNLRDRPTSAGPWIMGATRYRLTHQPWNLWLSIMWLSGFMKPLKMNVVATKEVKISFVIRSTSFHFARPSMARPVLHAVPESAPSGKPPHTSER